MFTDPSSLSWPQMLRQKLQLPGGDRLTTLTCQDETFALHPFPPAAGLLDPPPPLTTRTPLQTPGTSA